MRNKITIVTLLALCSAWLTSCSWVKDDLSDCPTGQWLQLEYTYNMLDVDAANKQVGEATVFIYDTKGNYIKQLQVGRQQLEQNGYRVELTGLPEGDYRFVVWGGLSDEHYLLNESQAFDTFRLSLSTNEQHTVEHDLGDLFFGHLDSVRINDNYAVHRVPLTKDTNRLACIVESEDANNAISTNVYTMELVAANGALDANNALVSDTKMHYLPFAAQDVVIDDPDLGERKAAQFDLTTLRLLYNDNARLILKLKDTDYEVFNIPVSQYIGQVASLYELNGNALSEQEYIDRQDQHTFVFYLSSSSSALIRCRVNNWIMRLNDNVKF